MKMHQDRMVSTALELIEIGRREGRKQALEETAEVLQSRLEAYEQAIEKKGLKKVGLAALYDRWARDVIASLQATAQDRCA